VARKGQAGAGGINLDSFLDIMTCLVGVLVLIIILIGIDASQTRVLIPTPVARETDKRPIFIEARNDQLFMVPLDRLQATANTTLRNLRIETDGNIEQLLGLMSRTNVEDEAYRIDLSYALMGQLALHPLPDVSGYPLEDIQKEGPTDWFGRILDGMNKDEEMLTFIVRDDSFRVFKFARALAWHEEVDVAYELIGRGEPIRFGLAGTRIKAQ